MYLTNLAMLKNYILGVFLFCNFISAAQESSSISVFFDINSSTANPQETEKLKRFTNQLSSENVQSISLVAYADAPGSDAHNLSLGEKRLQNINEILNKQFPDSLFEFKNNSTTAKESPDYNAALRRVDLKFTLKTKEDLGPGIEYLLAQLAMKAETFIISNQRDTVLRSREGSLIYVPANAFLGGDLNRPIRLTLKEVRKKSDMILERLTTQSNGRMLISDGMFNLEAQQNNRPLKIDGRKKISIFKNKEEKLANPQLFIGENLDSLHYTDWKLNRQNSLQSISDFQYLRSFGYSLYDCPLFFCKFQRLFRGDLAIKRRISTRYPNYLQAYFQKYEVSDLKQLKAALIESNPSLKGKINSLKDLDKVLKEMEREEMEDKISEGAASTSELSYYLFNMGNLNWINIDSFYNLPKEELTTQKILVDVAGHTDVKIVFKDLNSVLRPNGTTNGAYYFKDIPKGEAAYALGLQYIRGEAYIAISEFKIGEKVELNYQKASLERIKETLKTIDS